MDEFRKLKTDKERWQWLLKNQDKGLIVMLDNDDTFLVHKSGDEDYVSFDDYVGWADGIQSLLDAVGIAYEEV